MGATQNRISDEAVRKATGRGWSEWCAVLDRAGAAGWTHQEIVAHLHDVHGVGRWWQQMVTVGYEKASGRRTDGDKGASGFEVSLQATLPGTAEEVWGLLTSAAGLRCWLAPAGRFTLAEGKSYTTRDGARGEIRVVKPNARVRLTWQPAEVDRPVNVEIALTARPSGKTAVRVQLERLPSAECRDALRTRWMGVFVRLAGLVSGSA